MYFALETLLKQDPYHLDTPSDKGRFETLWCLAGSYALSSLMRALAAQQFRSLKLGGRATLSLRTAIFGTMVQLTPCNEENFETGSIVSLALHQTADAISKSWIAWFSLFEHIVNAVLIYGWVIFIVVTSDISALQAMGCLVVPPFMLACNFLILAQTRKTATKLHHNSAGKEHAWVQVLTDGCSLRNIITNYRKGQDVADAFANYHRAFNTANFQANEFSAGAVELAKMNSRLVTVATVIFIGSRVIFHGASVSVYTTLVSVINSVGPITGNIFAAVFDIEQGCAAVKEVAELLNADTRRKMLFRNRIEHETGRTDAVVCKNVEYHFHYKSHVHVDAIPSPRSKSVRKNGKATENRTPESGKLGRRASMVSGTHAVQVVAINQEGQNGPQAPFPPFSENIAAGQIIALTGPPATNKRTILRLIARQIMPAQGGHIIYPENWRVRYVEAPPQFFRSTLWENLTFGVKFIDDNIGILPAPGPRVPCSPFLLRLVWRYLLLTRW